MKTSERIITTALALLSIECSMAQQATVYTGVTLIDSEARTATPDAYIVVQGELITDVGTGRPPSGEGLRQVDLSGLYALPGLIDAHAHITSGWTELRIENGRPVIEAHSLDHVTQHNALTALASGVTTIRNPAGNTQANARYDSKVASGQWLGPQASHAGLIFEPVPIIGGSVYPSDEAGWQEEVQRQKSLGMSYIKLYTGLTEAELAMGVRLARSNAMQTIAHLDQISWLDAIDIGVDALTHALPTSPDLLEEPHRTAYIESRAEPSSKFMYQWFEYVDYDSDPMQELFARLAESGTAVDLTLAVNELVNQFDQLDSIYPSELRADFAHPDMFELWLQQLSGSHIGWTDEDYARAHAVMPKVLELAKRLHESGAALMLGTDGLGGGPAYLRELQLHVSAGIDVWDVLALATTLNAERLGIGNRTGAIRPGLEADIVFVSADPIADIGNVKDVEFIVTNGSAHRAGDLLESRDRLVAGGAP